MTDIDAKCPKCGQNVTLTLGPMGGPIICSGCSFDIDPADFIDFSHRIHDIHDILHKTMPGAADIPDDLLAGALKGGKDDSESP